MTSYTVQRFGWGASNVACDPAYFLGILLGSPTSSQAAEPHDIGEAVVIKNLVTAADQQQDKRRLAKGDAVREQELLETQTASHGEFRLADDTKLALGPDARLVLDKFVYDRNTTSRQVLIIFAAGAFRFISASKDPTVYELKTSPAAIGIRGTVFDFYVADRGRHGGADAQGRRRGLYRQLQAAQQVGSAGLCHPLGQGHSAQQHWDRRLLPGVSIKQAFPFLGKKLTIDDVVRFASLTAPAGKAASWASKLRKRPARPALPSTWMAQCPLRYERCERQPAVRPGLRWWTRWPWQRQWKLAECGQRWRQPGRQRPRHREWWRQQRRWQWRRRR